jgi:hypothetical protein
LASRFRTGEFVYGGYVAERIKRLDGLAKGIIAVESLRVACFPNQPSFSPGAFGIGNFKQPVQLIIAVFCFIPVFLDKLGNFVGIYISTYDSYANKYKVLPPDITVLLFRCSIWG